MKAFYLGVLLLLGNQYIFSQCPVIPLPLSVTEEQGGEYRFRERETIVLVSDNLENEALELQRVLKHRTGRESGLMRSRAPKTQAINLVLDREVTDDEGYRLRICPEAITITGKTAAGVFYGIQTLDQLLVEDGGNSRRNSMKAVNITDRPRYSYRALMLDPARHFIPLNDVKRYIELMSRYKFNVLQLHLTDDQGWRIEIEKYPLLTQKAAFRDDQSGDHAPQNGYYTQQQLKELIEYAAGKHVEIVPELDIPGHTAAAIYAYPALGCEREDTASVVLGKTTDRMLCAANEEVYTFYTGVLQEVCRIFPSKRIHLGGDEAVIGKNWGKCKRCWALMQARGLQQPEQLMGIFFERIEDMVRKEGKELMLWCELDNIRMPAQRFLFDYPKDCTLFTWRMGLTPKTIELTGEAGIRLIASPGEHCYFDYPQWAGDLPEFNNWGMPLLSLKRAYDFDPGYGLPTEKQKHITGVAGLLWGEAIQDIHRATYMTYPRALALAEAGWSVMENRSWESFKTRLYPQLADLMREGVSFRVPFEIR